MSDDVTWTRVSGYEDIHYDKSPEGIARVTINRPEVHNAFRPQTVAEMIRAFDDARDDGEVGVVVLTGEGPNAFCSGGDQRVRGAGGYVGTEPVRRPQPTMRQTPAISLEEEDEPAKGKKKRYYN